MRSKGALHVNIILQWQISHQIIFVKGYTETITLHKYFVFVMNCTYTHDIYKYYQMNAVKLANQNNWQTSPFTVKFQRIKS